MWPGPYMPLKVHFLPPLLLLLLFHGSYCSPKYQKHSSLRAAPIAPLAVPSTYFAAFSSISQLYLSPPKRDVPWERLFKIVSPPASTFFIVTIYYWHFISSHMCVFGSLYFTWTKLYKVITLVCLWLHSKGIKQCLLSTCWVSEW